MRAEQQKSEKMKEIKVSVRKCEVKADNTDTQKKAEKSIKVLNFVRLHDGVKWSEFEKGR